MIKKQHAKHNCVISRLKCNKQYERIAFRSQNATSKVRLRNLEIGKHQERLNDIKNGTRYIFRGWKTLSKVKLMYLEVKFKEAKFG